MASLTPTPRFQFIDDDGAPLFLGKLYSYEAGTNTPLATYTDSTGMTANTNPLILDAYGSGNVWLSSSLYKLVLTDPNDSVIWTVDNVGGGVTLAQLAGTGTGQGAALIGFIQSGTGAVARAVQTELRETIKSTQYITLQAAVNAAENKRLLVIGNYTITSAVTLPSNIVIDFDAGATITSNTQNISHFQATGKTNITVRGGKFVATNPGANAYYGGVHLESCTSCLIENNEFTGMQWGGVYLLDCDYNVVRRNRFSAFLGTVSDSADIVIHGNSSYNDIVENDCRGGRVHGVLNQGHTAGVFPRRNNISRNKIGAHTGYGVAVYQIDAGDTFTLVEGNTIEGITGTALEGSAGAGIYVVASGGCIIKNNRIKDCCLNSSNETLTPAGIGINGINAPRQPLVIEGNEITDIRGYSCINISSCDNSVIVANNVVQVAAGITLTRGGIYINASDNTQVIGNKVVIDATIATSGIFVFANGRSISNITVANNHVVGTNSRGIRFDRTAANRGANLIVQGNNVSGGGANCIPFDVVAYDGVTFTGNTGIAPSLEAMRINNTTQIRGSANRLITNGGGTVPSFTTQNPCTDSFFDATNYFNARITNSGTGCIVERYGTAAPTEGTQAVGDRTINSVPTVGQPKAWVTTVAGSPGTQVSEGNL